MLYMQQHFFLNILGYAFLICIFTNLSSLISSFLETRVGHFSSTFQSTSSDKPVHSIFFIFQDFKSF